MKRQQICMFNSDFYLHQVYRHLKNSIKVGTSVPQYLGTRVVQGEFQTEVLTLIQTNDARTDLVTLVVLFSIKHLSVLLHLQKTSMEDKQAYRGDLNNGHGKMDCINTKQKQVQMGSKY